VTTPVTGTKKGNELERAVELVERAIVAANRPHLGLSSQRSSLSFNPVKFASTAHISGNVRHFIVEKDDVTWVVLSDAKTDDPWMPTRVKAGRCPTSCATIATNGDRKPESGQKSKACSF
jgi:hypothetical protein